MKKDVEKEMGDMHDELSKCIDDILKKSSLSNEDKSAFFFEFGIKMCAYSLSRLKEIDAAKKEMLGILDIHLKSFQELRKKKDNS